MFPLGSIFNDAAIGTGFMAAAIAVTGFLTHVWPVITGKDEEAVRLATVIGGLLGFCIAVGVLAGSWMQ